MEETKIETQEEMMTAPRRRELKRLEEKLGVKFNKIENLNAAFLHTSYANERNLESNERLEFLGDAVLELASSTYLYENFPELSEGQLTKTRASIVCSTTLAKLGKKLGLGKMLLLGHGEEVSGGRERISNLEDTFETVIGALYLDSGWEVAKDYVIRQLAPEFQNAKIGKNLKDFKTTLQEFVQRFPNKKVEYVELGSTGPDHMKTFECAAKIDGKIYGKGTGKSKKLAEQAAAEKTLKMLKKDKNFGNDFGDDFDD